MRVVVGVLPSGARALLMMTRRLWLRLSGEAHFIAELMSPQPLVTCAASDRGSGGH